MYGFDCELRENAGWTCVACCVGDDSGEPLESDDRSEEDEWMDTNYRNRSAKKGDPSVLPVIEASVHEQAWPLDPVVGR